MPWVRTDAGVMHVKTSKRLNLCHCRRFADLKCDWPTEDGGTCSKPVCTYCARHVGPDVDYCPFHRGDPPMTEEQQKTAGEKAAAEAAKILGVKR
ncbi:MAG: hypothetical protein IT566_10095 [Rhodospirillaceae bacterium]|nr:hypothetical protein [Rhodospirillaceae bacterium]